MSRAIAIGRLLPGLLAATLAGCLHWIPASQTVQLAVVALGWLGLILQAGRPLFVAALGVAVSETVSCWWHGLSLRVLIEGALPWLNVAPLLADWRGSREFWLTRVFWLAELLALHAVVCFLAFRWVGGGHRIRPEISSAWIEWLVWPYYCGHYPRGAHAIGLFLNDNNLGLWCLAIFLIGLVRLKRPGYCLGLAVVWSYSRAAALSLVCALSFLARRWNPRVLMLLLFVPVGFIFFATWLDFERFAAPLGSVAYPAERVFWLGRAAQVLGSGSLLGQGPASAGLVDSQWCKTAVEQGWAGILAWGYFLAQVKQGSRDPGLQSAVLVLVVGSVGNDILYSPLLVATLLGLSGLAWEQESRSCVPISTIDREDETNGSTQAFIHQ